MKKLFTLLFFFALVPIAQAQAAHSNTFNWTASTSIGATYNVYKQPACTGVFVKVNTVTITGLTFTDTGMADGEINCYYVSAVVGTSESLQSQSIIFRLVTPSSTPPTQVIVIPPVATG